MTTTFGVAFGGHDASLAAVVDDRIVFASEAERYSRLKCDGSINADLVNAAVSRAGEPDVVVYYERPWRSNLRRRLSGQAPGLSRTDVTNTIRSHPTLQRARILFSAHHESHAAAGYFTSGFDDATIIVADGIGEWDTLSIWEAQGSTLKRRHVSRYPHSLGLFYAAFTDRLGLRPNQEEFIMMALAAFGRPTVVNAIKQEFVAECVPPKFRLKRSMHRGIRDWEPGSVSPQDIAASVQCLTEQQVLSMVEWAARNCRSRNLVYAGGVALNCVANTRIANSGHFERMWIMPNPGDGGAGLGAALQHLKRQVAWPGPFLGCEIARSFDAEGAAAALASGRIVGVANGRAEFGPRALGNRSLHADPRPSDMKDRVNDVKRREPFRPFAPMICESDLADYFETPGGQSMSYMQYAVRCLRPQEVPAVCHVDGSSRVQVVTSSDYPKAYELLQRFKKLTGCPVLLNTSLNIKGEPIVNDWNDAMRFQEINEIEVF